MREQFDVILTGSDSPIEGIASAINLPGYSQAYEFKSIDETLQLVIGMDNAGKWHRVDGSEPYLSGWTNELADLVAAAKK
jgi:hypothetical protein